jgi:uncharacterized RDD family membrane protein YckC
VNRNFRTVTIETPEHFELQFQLAGIGVRFLAFLVDRLIQAGAILGLLFVVTLFLSMSGVIAEVTDFFVAAGKYIGQWVIAFAIVLYGVISIGYFILFEYLWSGATPGKRFQEIRVIRKDGRPLTFLDAAIRNILRFVDLLGDVYPLGLLVMFLDSKSRRLGDMAAGTLVVMETTVREPFVPRKPKRVTEADPQLRDVVSCMTPEDYRLIAKFLARRNELDSEYRSKLVREILDSILDKAPHSITTTSEPERLMEKLQALYMERTRIF